MTIYRVEQYESTLLSSLFILYTCLFYISEPIHELFAILIGLVLDVL